MTTLDTGRDALRLLPVDTYLGIYTMGHVSLSLGLLDNPGRLHVRHTS